MVWSNWVLELNLGLREHNWRSFSHKSWVTWPLASMTRQIRWDSQDFQQSLEQVDFPSSLETLELRNIGQVLCSWASKTNRRSAPWFCVCWTNMSYLYWVKFRFDWPLPAEDFGGHLVGCQQISKLKYITRFGTMPWAQNTDTEMHGKNKILLKLPLRWTKIHLSSFAKVVRRCLALVSGSFFVQMWWSVAPSFLRND